MVVIPVYNTCDGVVLFCIKKYGEDDGKRIRRENKDLMWVRDKDYRCEELQDLSIYAENIKALLQQVVEAVYKRLGSAE
jgi:hypothetical protein